MIGFFYRYLYFVFFCLFVLVRLLGRQRKGGQNESKSEGLRAIVIEWGDRMIEGGWLSSN